MRPAELDYVVSQDKVGDPARPLPAEGSSFLDTSTNNVALVTWKQAENGNGSILRLQETGGQASAVAVHFLRSKIASAQLCTGMEDDLRAIPVESDSLHLTFQPFEVLTVRVKAESSKLSLRP
jgi:alpha-mannosidase